MPPLPLAALAVSFAACLWLLAGRRGEGLGLPLIAVMSFGFLYLVQPFFLARAGQLELFLNDRQVAAAFLWPALALPAFVFGWIRRPAPPPPALPWDPKRLWCFGLFTASLGLAVYAVFILRSGGFEAMFRLQHGQGASWGENTAYLYLAPWWTITGISAMFVAASRIPGRPARWLLPGAFTALMWLNAILLSSRTFLFAATVAAAAAIALGRAWQVTLRRAAPAALALGLGVLAILGFRPVLHLGESGTLAPGAGEALTAVMNIDPGSALRRITGNEFVVHAAVLDTVNATGKYDFGINWAFVYLVHPIPRVLWPDKPYRFETPGVGPSDIYAQTGVVVAGGAAPGIVADLYSNFGVASLAFLWLFGAASRRLYARALTLHSPLATVSYVMLLASSLNCFAQGFGAILVPLPYALAPMLLFALSQRALVRDAAALARPGHPPAPCLPS